MDIADAVQVLAEHAVTAARELTRAGERIDDHQVAVERVAYAATEARVIGELLEVPAELAPAAHVAIAELAASLRYRLEPVAADLGMPEPQYDDSVRASIAGALAPAKVEVIGEA